MISAASGAQLEVVMSAMAAMMSETLLMAFIASSNAVDRSAALLFAKSIVISRSSQLACSARPRPAWRA